MAVKYTWANGEQFTASDANAVGTAVNAAYVKPGTGIPSTDLAAAAQTSLGKADSAVQSVASTNITDATTTGRAILTTTDASTARTTLGVAYGTSGTTVAVGNDARFTPASTAISDSTTTGRALLTTTDASTARTTLGVAYGTASGTVAQGNDTRITGAEQTSAKGVANGYAALDGNGRIPVAQLSTSVMEYQGSYNPSTNSPTLADGTGSAGDVYRVSVAASRNLGSGSISFEIGDLVIYNGTIWQKADTTDAVTTVAGRTGDVVLAVSDITASTSLALGVGTVELGHATDTTLSRSAAGVLAVEGVDVVTTTATQTLTNKTLTSPRVNQILDTNGNVSVLLGATASAVNYLQITNGAAGTSAGGFVATGASTDLNIDFTPKGVGVVRILGVPIVTTTGGVTLSNKTLASPTITGTATIASSSVPSTATSTGTTGQIAYDSSFVYICTATNTWRRAAIASW